MAFEEEKVSACRRAGQCTTCKLTDTLLFAYRCNRLAIWARMLTWPWDREWWSIADRCRTSRAQEHSRAMHRRDRACWACTNTSSRLRPSRDCRIVCSCNTNTFVDNRKSLLVWRCSSWLENNTLDRLLSRTDLAHIHIEDPFLLLLAKTTNWNQVISFKLKYKITLPDTAMGIYICRLLCRARHRCSTAHNSWWEAMASCTNTYEDTPIGCSGRTRWSRTWADR